MKPCGIILTYMSRQDWKGKSNWIKLRTIFFNLILFVFQLVFMVVGTAIGKIKWSRDADSLTKLLAILIVGFCIIGILHAIVLTQYWSFPIFALASLIAVATYRGIDWRKVWRAAQCSHVRLCLKGPDSNNLLHWQYINFGWKFAKLEYWRPEVITGKRFEYRDPTFDPSAEFITAMIQYAHDQVGNRYDDYQLASPMLNFPIWIIYPPWWGKQKIGWANRPGGLEFCSSGVTACLRWAESAKALKILRGVYPSKDFCPNGQTSDLFPSYDTAMVMPCLFPIDENWREV